ncbi:PPE family protein [Nocardia sp. NPDC006044]|uniref:PPE family protein n=1 Tax=Nocardia sp. NPDC006044 TaxID=3364306 RepID=UPI0036737C6D
MFDFGAAPPELACAMLLTGPGEAPMSATAAAYAQMADALLAAAGGSDGSTGALSASWRSPASDKAQAAFRNHANWLRHQSAVAGRVAAAAASVAAAYSAARTYAAAMLPVILANRATSVGLASTNAMGQNTPALAANEAVYIGLWAQTAAVMNAYAGQAMSALSTVPPPTMPPGIAMPGGGGAPLSAPGAPGAGAIGSPDGLANAGDTVSTLAEQAGDPVSQAGDSVSNAAQSVPEQPLSPDSLTQQAISDVNQAANLNSDSLANPGGSGVDGGLAQHGFAGTSPYSPTLAGLNGSVGSLAPLSMIRGGLGQMSGVSTGFRMPTNWSSMGPGTAFGASPQPVAGAPVGRAAAPRGASAPAGQLRRRADDTQRKAGKIFTPGELYEVPLLDRAPSIGVLEYSDGDEPDESAFDDRVLLGVLQRDDEDSAPPTQERPR